jgi:hypothetical protein
VDIIRHSVKAYGEADGQLTNLTCALVVVSHRNRFYLGRGSVVQIELDTA